MDAEVLDEFVECARYGEQDDVEEYLRAGVDVNATNSSRNTALHCAAANNHVALVTRLLDLGAAIDARNEQGNTPLAWAASARALAAVRVLVERGASLNAVNALGKTPLDLCYHEHEDVREFLLSKGAQLGESARKALAASTTESPAAAAPAAAAPAAATAVVSDNAAGAEVALLELTATAADAAPDVSLPQDNVSSQQQ